MRIGNLCLITALASFLTSTALQCQPAPPVFTSLPDIHFDVSGPAIQAHAETEKPFTVAGERGVLLGRQDGTFEAWLLPVKLLSNLTLEAEVEGYTVPIDVNQHAAEIEVRPDRTIVTYSHIGFTVRQIMFSPNDAPTGTGPVVLYEFDCLRPTDFTFRFTPELRWMWPERNEGVPVVEWVAPGPTAYAKAGGFYVMHSDYPDFAGAITIPGARPGILAPYQERPQVHPVELKLHIDPVRDHGRLFPLLMAIGTDRASANSGALGTALEKLNAGIAAGYAAHADSYTRLLAGSTSIETPDNALNEAFQWAMVSVEQLKAKPQGANETALVAGYYASGDSARPGFGWFFGRDALYTLYAVNGYGDFALSKSELEFLIHRQRADGKIMHEYSQTAAAIDWQAFPYMYAAADATPLFLLAMLDYVKTSGDVAFVAAHRDAVEKAWMFETGHAPDAQHGGNGIYDNTQGTGWVESWPGGMPHQEIYLALLDQQASAAMVQLESLLGDSGKAQAARLRASRVATTIEAQFHDSAKGCYAFSRNADGSLDYTTTVYPALAWWSGESILAHSDECLRQFASHILDTDWGLRDVSNEEKVYDGMSYHQGSVWPLFTGWAALAEYRGGQALAGYRMLKENANLTRTQDLGGVTELLSGDFFVPFGRSTSHQLWSSAMVITPVLRGLFGLDIDAQARTITVNPHLPAAWSDAAIKHLSLPDGSQTVSIHRKSDHLEIGLDHFGAAGWKLRSDLAGAHSSVDAGGEATLHIPLPKLEVDALMGTRAGDALSLPPALNQPPLPGARTERFRILREDYADHRLVLVIEGPGGTNGAVNLVRRASFIPKPHWELTGASDTDTSYGGISFADSALHDASTPLLLSFHFPEGDSWKTLTVTLTW